MLFLAGVPLFFLEAALGQFCGQSSFEAFNCIPLLKGEVISLSICTVFINGGE